jgi:D-tyrosyl-tRNA(Tyr) deacylase
MKLVIQRVKRASVTIDGQVVSSIGQGFMVLWGSTHEDTKEIAEHMARKLINMRIFSDEDDKMNLGLKDIGGELLVVSQFTLYADCKKGNRPNFMKAMKPKESNELYEYFLELLRKEIPDVKTGEFGADMQVELINDGPVTIVLDSQEVM